MKTWIFLSTHFDDVVLSAGGMVWELSQRGDPVEIWTICAGDPPADKPLTEHAQLVHGFWNIGDDVPIKRSKEDAACCQVLGASSYRRYTVPDCIYRYHPVTGEAVIKDNDDIFKPLETDEAYLIPQVADFLRKNLPDNCELVAPLAIGSHRDHVLTRKSAERLGGQIWHYADYPYLIYGEHSLVDWLPKNPEIFSVEVSPEGLKAWQNGFACQQSQIPLLFMDEEDMRESIEKYFKSGYGFTLWKF
jgi:LmbE family N-acetylglucosaminyl deacetylase